MLDAKIGTDVKHRYSSSSDTIFGFRRLHQLTGIMMILNNLVIRLEQCSQQCADME